MRSAAVHCCSIVALLMVAATAIGQEPPAEAKAPLAGAYRDAQHLAACMKTLDTACVVALSDVPSYQLLAGDPDFRYPKAQGRLFNVMKRQGWSYSVFEVSPPQDIYVDGGRLYTFVPYTSTSNFGGRTSLQEAFLIALSSDGGDTWTFVDSAVNREYVKRIVPSYNNPPLPEVRFMDGARTESPARTRWPGSNRTSPR